MLFARASGGWPPGGPRRSVEALQAGQIGPGAEVVQVEVRRGDRRVAHPVLHRADIDTARQPEAGGGVSQVVDATAPPGLPTAGSATVSFVALVTCLECGRQVSSAAESCPGCGFPEPGAAYQAAYSLGLQARAELLAELASDDEDDRIRFYAAANPLLPRDLLAAHVTGDEPVLRAAAAANPATPAELLAQLAGDADTDVRLFLALNRSTPQHVLSTFAGDADPEVLTSLAANTSTPPEILTELAATRSRLTRFRAWERREIVAAVAENPSVPPEVLATLALSPAWVPYGTLYENGWRVNSCAAANSSIGAELLDELASYILERDSDPRSPEDIEACYVVLPRIAGNTNASPRTLRRLSDVDRASSLRMPVLGMREPLAANPNVPGDLLASFAVSSDSEYRAGAARNSSILPAMLEALAKDDYASVRQGAAANPSVSDRTLKSLASDKFDSVRASVAGNAMVTSELLSTLATDEDSWVRRATAGNMRTPIHRLAALAYDKDFLVRKAFCLAKPDD